MTDEEYKILLDRLMQSIRTNSKTIDQLSEVESVPTDGYLELNRGRKILASRFQKILDTPLTALDYSSMWKSLESSTDEQINTSHLTDALKGLTGNLGTVTMVGVSVPQGLVVANSPVKESGVIAISYAEGYSLPTNVKQSNWDTAFSFVDNITKSDTDTVINKWEEIVKFLDGISSSTDLASMLALKMNQSTWDEFKKTTYYHDHPNKALLDSITDTQVYNWNQAAKSSHTHSNKAVLDNLTQAVIDNSHTHTNKATLDVIDQSLSTASAVKFAKVTANDAELGTIKATTGDFSGAVKAAAATVIGLITCATLNADAATIPTINSTNINASTQVVSPLFVGRLQGNADTASRLQTARTIWGQSFDGSSDVIGLFTNQDVHIGYTNEIFTTNTPLYLNYASRGSQPVLMCTGFGNVGIGTTAPLYKLDVNANMRVASDLYADATVGTRNFVSHTTGWRADNNGNADFRNIYADELRVQAFTADISQALAGSDYLTKSVSKLSANFVVPSVNSTVRIIVDDIEGMPATQCFENGDYIRFRAFNRTSGLTISDVWGTVQLDNSFGTNGFSNGTQAYIFTVTSAAVTGLTVYKGSEVLDYGKSSDGLIVRTTLDKNNSPYSQIATWVNDPSNSANYTVHARLGKLSGIAHCSGYGLYTDNAFLTSSIVVGDLTKANNYLSYNPTEGLVVKGNLYVSSGAVASTSDVNTAKASAIDAASNDATTKANSALTSAKSYADTGDGNTLTSAKSYTNTQFSVADGKITAAITTTKNYTDNAVNNIQIGGRNLLRYSNDFSKWTLGTTYSSITTDGYLKYSDNYFSNQYGPNRITVSISGYYTISFTCTEATSSKIHIEFKSIDTNQGVADKAIIKGKNILTTYLDSGEYNFSMFGNANGSNYVIIKNDIMVERSNKPSDWSPAPEDVDSAIATKVATTTYDAKMTLIDGQIKFKVSQDDFNALGKRVSSTESSITQLPSSIDARITTQVQAGGSIYSAVATSLTMTSDGISLFGKNIHLSGAVTFVSSLNQTAQGYATTAANNIQIGGRNYLRNTISNDKSANVTFIKNGVEIDFTNQRDTYFGIDTASDITLLPTPLTLSFYVSGLADSDDVRFYFNGAQSFIYTIKNGVNSISNFNINNNNSLFFDDWKRVSSSKVQITKFKLEKGTKATDWTPAPEDVDSAIATSQTSAQNNLAVKLGYTDYATLAASASLQHTLINGGYINTDCILAHSIGVDKLVAQSITSDYLAAGAITTDKLAANAVTAEKINVTDLTANSAFISNLKTNIVNAAYVNTLGITSLGAVTAGSFNLGSGKFSVSADGTLNCKGATISGTLNGCTGSFSGNLSGVSGTFTTLTTNGGGIICKDASGSEIFYLTSSQFYIQAIDMQHQGVYHNRSLRFLSSNIRCRGVLGYRKVATAVVIGTTIRYYVNGDDSVYGADGGYVECTMKSAGTIGEVAYYKIYLNPSFENGYFYSTTAYGACTVEDLNGFQVNAIIFNNTVDYRYKIEEVPFAQVSIINSGANWVRWDGASDAQSLTKNGGSQILYNCGSWLNKTSTVHDGSLSHSCWWIMADTAYGYF